MQKYCHNFIATILQLSFSPFLTQNNIFSQAILGISVTWIYFISDCFAITLYSKRLVAKFAIDTCQCQVGKGVKVFLLYLFKIITKHCFPLSTECLRHNMFNSGILLFHVNSYVIVFTMHRILQPFKEENLERLKHVIGISGLY